MIEHAVLQGLTDTREIKGFRKKMGFKVSNDHLGDSHVFYKGSQVT